MTTHLELSELDVAIADAIANKTHFYTWPADTTGPRCLVCGTVFETAEAWAADSGVCPGATACGSEARSGRDIRGRAMMYAPFPRRPRASRLRLVLSSASSRENGARAGDVTLRDVVAVVCSLVGMALFLAVLVAIFAGIDVLRGGG